MKNLAIGWLVWLTEENMSRRLDMVKKSAKSLDVFLKQDFYDLLIINNAGIKELPIDLPKNSKIIFSNSNYYDVAVQFFTYFYALNNSLEYFAFLYDDFIVYKDPFKECLKFMNDNKEIDCLRLPSYVTNDPYYNKDLTNKKVNPDAVSHREGAGDYHKKTKLIQTGPIEVNNEKFYFSNWRPNSRPTLWRTKSYSKFLDSIERYQPIMQSYERKIIEISDKLAIDGNYNSSYLEGGMCRTFGIETSERTRVDQSYLSEYKIDMSQFHVDYLGAINGAQTTMGIL